MDANRITNPNTPKPAVMKDSEYVLNPVTNRLILRHSAQAKRLIKMGAIYDPEYVPTKRKGQPKEVLDKARLKRDEMFAAKKENLAKPSTVKKSKDEQPITNAANDATQKLKALRQKRLLRRELEAVVQANESELEGLSDSESRKTFIAQKLRSFLMAKNSAGDSTAYSADSE